MPKKKKTNHQLARIRRDKQYESVNRNAKEVLAIWAKEHRGFCEKDGVNEHDGE